MRFGPVPVSDAAGTITAHSVKAGPVVLRKGDTVSEETAHALAREGIASLVVARLEPGDVGEDAAALALAEAAAGPGLRVERPFTGRANLFARSAGLLLVDRTLVDAVNAVDEAVTLATLPAFRPVVEGEMVATVKIIPYAVPRRVLETALASARGGAAIALAPYRLARVGVVSTLTAALKPSVVAKTVAALAGRLAPAGAAIVAEETCPHEMPALAAALARQAASEAEMIVVFGASAIADRRDVIPAAIGRAGGEVVHFGMPVDPGNLLLVGRIGGKPVIGAPGCARSPRENGFDWILGRLLAGIEVTRADIQGLGVGGLLMEIVSRGQPRDGGDPAEEDG